MKRSILIFSAFFICLLLVGCININKEITGEKFFKVAKEMGYETEFWEEGKGDVLKFDTYIAKKNDYMIIFYSTDEEKNTENFETLKSIFQWKKEEYSGQEFNSSTPTHEKYSVIANGYYNVISKTKNTTIRVEAPKQYKEEIDIFLNKVGY